MSSSGDREYISKDLFIKTMPSCILRWTSHFRPGTHIILYTGIIYPLCIYLFHTSCSHFGLNILLKILFSKLFTLSAIVLFSVHVSPAYVVTGLYNTNWYNPFINFFIFVKTVINGGAKVQKASKRFKGVVPSSNCFSFNILLKFITSYL